MRIATFLSRSSWALPFQAARTLWSDYGYVRSARAGRAVDAGGQPIPWYTYPAIHYLAQLDFSDKDVFEFGAGQSTFFWAARARRVVSVEDDEAWHAMVAQERPPNCELVLQTDLARYPHELGRFPEGFDVIVVDGAARGKTRLKCCRAALGAIRPGGMIILDNADWLPASSRLLREAGLIEVDMTGLVPLAAHTQTTSLFLDRAFAFAPVSRQPLPGPGAVEKIWEHDSPVDPPIVEFGGECFGGVEGDVPFEIASPEGVRRFRLLACRRTRDRGAAAAILDVDRERVLLSLNEATEGLPSDNVAGELTPLTSMSWDAFRDFVNAHPKRRFLI